MAIFRARGEELTVRGEHGEYEVEPARFARELTRVGMIDWHLADLVENSITRGGDVDALLDARNACAFVDTYTS